MSAFYHQLSVVKLSPTDIWGTLFNASNPLVPLLLAFLNADWTFPPFRPRQLLFSRSTELLPLLFAPWSISPSFGVILARLIHAALFSQLPPVSAVSWCYSLWIVLGLGRTIVGWALTRAVGWAFPKFFNHWALYEETSGFGAVLVVYIHLSGILESVEWSQRLRGRGTIAMIVLCGVLAWLENQPWTYAIAALGTALIMLSRQAFFAVKNRTLLPSTSRDDNGMYVRPAKVLAVMGLSFFAILLPHVPSMVLQDTRRMRLPPAPNPPSPLLDILFLSFPRSDVVAGTTILSATLNSYLPFLNSQTLLSVFTHSTIHPAFIKSQELYKGDNITFYIDNDTHPEAYTGQYLHLAEAFRWVLEKPSPAKTAEWVMLVEDDFPVCGGDSGWNAIAKVLSILEKSRSARNEIRSGFVGTGGSGLIIHRSVLPVLVLLLKTHAEISSSLPPSVVRRPPDVVIQDCLLGRDAICPRRGPDGEGTMVITSRLVLDHIGGMASTNSNKAGNSDKWRCGWRHPFHGMDEVEVVVV